MKKLMFCLPLLILLLVMTSCHDFNEMDSPPPPDDLPQIAIDFIQENFAGFSIVSVEEEDLCDNTIVFEVELEDGPDVDVDLYFSLDGDFLFAARPTTLADLPEAVLSSIEVDFADFNIEEDELEQFDFPDGSIQYSIALKPVDDNGSGLDLIYAEDGSLICNEDDQDDDDDTSIDLSDIPESVLAFIADNYNGFSIASAETEDLCDGSLVYEVELEDGSESDIDLYFSIEWEFLFAATDISSDVLPEAVLTAIETNFPNHLIDEDEIEQWEFTDGSIQYELELKPTVDGDSEIEVVLSSEGEIICQEEDDDDGDDDDGDDDDGDDDDGDDDDGDDDDGDDDDGDDDDGDDDDGDDDDGDDDDGDDDDGDDDDGDDDDGDDDDGNPSDIPSEITDFITTNYPGYSLSGFEIEDLCDNSLAYEIELEDGPGPDVDLYFSLDWVFLFTATEANADELPQAILDLLATDYADYEIDEVEKWEMADGSIQYEIELKPESGSSLTIILTQGGTIICMET